MLQNEIFEVVARDILTLPELERCNLSRTSDELAALKDQIKAEGRVRDPIIVWNYNGKDVAVDGMSRLKLHQELALSTPLMAYRMVFETIQDAKYWIRCNQDARRNLTDDQLAYYTGLLYLELRSDKENLRRYLVAKGRLDLLTDNDDDMEYKTGELLGKIYRMSDKTMRRNSHFANGLEMIRAKNPELAEDILHQAVMVDGRQVKVARALVEKFGRAKQPRQIRNLFDVQEAVDMIPKQSDDRDESESDAIEWLLEKFYETPSLSLIQEINQRLNQYLNYRLSLGEPN